MSRFDRERMCLADYLLPVAAAGARNTCSGEFNLPTQGRIAPVLRFAPGVHPDGVTFITINRGGFACDPRADGGARGAGRAAGWHLVLGKRAVHAPHPLVPLAIADAEGQMAGAQPRMTVLLDVNRAARRSSR